MQQKYDIFISYRRDGGYDTAKHLNDLLVKDGYRVSFDLDTLRSGDFDIQLLSRIDECTDFILIVDPHAFDRTLNPDFDPQKDWLRNELAHALKQKKNIVPVFLYGICEFPNNLPEDICEVSKKNGPEYNRYYFDNFYKDLKKRFLKSKPHRSYVKYLILLAILIALGILWTTSHSDSGNQSSLSSSPELSTETIDSNRYYTGTFNEKDLYIKGLRRGILYDAGTDEHNEGAHYTYRCGRVIDIHVLFYQSGMIFISTDESGERTHLSYDFGTIGYESIESEEEKYEYTDNQYIIGQCDIDGDQFDELIISVRTAGDSMLQNGYGVGINIFKLVGGAWKRIAELNQGTNVLPAYAKIINNNIYIAGLRYDEKYSLVNDSLIWDDSFYGRVFKESDF